MLVVDDNSPDGTGRLGDELAAKNPFLHVLHRSEKDGLGRAYCAGFAWALQRGYEFIMEMDCDFSHDPNDIPRFIEAAGEADLVLGSRYCNGIRVINWPMKRLRGDDR
jgi:dolichol-phosphate mannosyltransferase